MRTILGLSTLLLLTTSCTKVFFQPDRYYYAPPPKLGLTQEEITFPSKDGTKLAGWFFHSKAKHPKGTIIQFHGNAENMSSHYLSLVWIIDHGYNLFTFDYRGYGKSEGNPDLEGVHEDGIAALNEGWKLHLASLGKVAPEKSRFIVYGQSLGSAIAMSTFDEWEHKADTKLIVMDSSFHSYTEIARSKLSEHWLTWLFQPLGWLLVSDKYASDDALKRNHVRMLVIHDDKDPVVPYDIGQEVYSMDAGQKEFWKLDQGYHVGVFAPKNVENKARFVKLLDSL